MKATIKRLNRSIAGTTMKVLMLAIIGMALAGIAYWGYCGVLDRIQLAQRKHQAGDIFLVLLAYAKDHNGSMPSSFSQLSPWDREQKVMQGVSTVVEREIPNFELVTTDTPDSSQIWIRERYPDSRGRRVVCYRGGDSAVLLESH